ncbi:hypothetical protein MIND_00985500 [Mycena indigotica]|uniref:Uncharacterized protein n=1 Tax=Mycena indigotica TaxID=2126181 RepID=A0A8H6SDG9_9AGAR|nr:uncharacterized protein MIND_00985500 [Mycena indigotica]KAF7297515.1 hypothetical protein MIND_00985500 [Mycena indigotica]
MLTTSRTRRIRPAESQTAPTAPPRQLPAPKESNAAPAGMDTLAAIGQQGSPRGPLGLYIEREKRADVESKSYIAQIAINSVETASPLSLNPKSDRTHHLRPRCPCGGHHKVPASAV